MFGWDKIAGENHYYDSQADAKFMGSDDSELSCEPRSQSQISFKITLKTKHLHLFLVLRSRLSKYFSFFSMFDRNGGPLLCK